jgi:LacI family transcriptional regulator
MAKKITQHLIARELGISIGTIDRALHNRPGISEETKQRILDFVKQHEYTPDRIASSLARKAKPTRVGVILQKEPAFFWSKVRNGILAAERELADFGVEVIIREMQSVRNTAEILHLLDELVRQSVEAIIMVPTNDVRLREQIARAADLGIKIITLNDDIDESQRLFYVGPQMRQGGRIAGEMMGRYLQGNGNVVIINGSIDSIDYHERIEGFKEVLKEQYAGIHVIATYAYDFANLKDNLEHVIQGVLESIDNIAGIYDADGASLYHIGDYVKKRRLIGRFVIIGHEIWDEVEKLIAEEIIQVCINQDPFAQGYYAVKLLINYLNNSFKPIHDRFYTRADIIIKENLTTRGNILNPFVFAENGQV